MRDLKREKIGVHDVAVMAMGVALIALCAWLSIPTTVPFTLQTFAVCLLAALFGLRRGVLTVGGYILFGAVGIPVFAGFQGGLGILLGMTGGYIVGFLFTALAVGLVAERWGRTMKALIPAMIIGILLCYLCGTIWFLLVYTNSRGPIGLGAVLSWCVLPYLVPDVVKLLLASTLAVRLYPLLRRRNSV